MSFFQSIHRYFSFEKVQLIVGEDVADLWPNPQRCESSSLAEGRGRVGLPAKKEPEAEASVAVKEETASDPIALPALKRDSDGLMHDFMQKCVEIAVGQQIKEQVLKNAKEKLEAAVAYHSILRQDYLALCSSVARVSALRPWLRSEKYLAETRIELEATRGPVREEDFWAPTKTFFDDDPLQEKLGPFPTREVVTGWDAGSWTVRSFQLLPSGEEGDSSELHRSSSCGDSASEVSEDDGTATKSRREPSMTSLRSLLRSDLDAISNDEDDDDDEAEEDCKIGTPRSRSTGIQDTPSWPSTDLTGKDREQIMRLCERPVDPRRSSIEMEERAAMKQGLRERDDLESYLKERINFVLADHTLSEKDDKTQMDMCTTLLQAITEIEVGWEVHKESTSAERNRAQILVLRLQWDLNGSQRLRKCMETKLGEKRQKQMDVWQDIVCAAALRGTPQPEETNIFGSIQWDPEVLELDEEDDELMLLFRGDARGSSDEESPGPAELVESDAEHFGLQEGDISGLVENEKAAAGPSTGRDEEQVRKASKAEELRTLRLDSGYDG